jgi:uncharacterized protein YciI
MAELAFEPVCNELSSLHVRPNGPSEECIMGEREQCWVINNEVIDPPPKLALSREQLTELHHQFIDDLDAKGVLVGAGPFLDDTGNRFGTGMIIFRAATRAEAEKIANSEPYIAHGTRRLRLVPWQRIAGH